jgi:hypothetical protein
LVLGERAVIDFVRRLARRIACDLLATGATLRALRKSAFAFWFSLGVDATGDCCPVAVPLGADSFNSANVSCGALGASTTGATGPVIREFSALIFLGETFANAPRVSVPDRLRE